MNLYSTRTSTETNALLVLTTDTIAAKMQAGELFTALDISNDLKARNLPVRHSEVAAIARGAFMGGGMSASGYNRTLISVSTPTGTAQAYLYHPDNREPAEYPGNAQDALPPVSADRVRPLDDAAPGMLPLSPLAKMTLRGMVGNTGINGNGKTAWSKPTPRRVRGKYRTDHAITIPRRVIENAGYQSGDLLMLTHDPETDTLTLQPVLPESMGVREALVNVWSALRVRLSRTKWRLAGLSTPPLATIPPSHFALDTGSVHTTR